MMDFKTYFKTNERSFRRPLWLAAVSACVVSISAVVLLGLSGWFLTGAAIAGAVGPLVAQGFNYLLPSAAIRMLAILRTVFRYGERLWGHEGGLMAMAQVRPHLFEQLSKGRPKAILALGQGEASSRFVQDVTALENAMVAKSAAAYAAAGLIAAVAMCAILSLQAALIGALGLVASMAVGWRLSLWLTARQAASNDEQTRLGDLKQRVFELAPLLPDMAAYDLDDAILSELAAREDALMAAKTRTLSLESLLTITSSVLLGLTLIAVTLISGSKDLPKLALALLGITMGFESAGSLLHALSQQGRYQKAAERVGEIYETERQAGQPTTSPEDGMIDYKYQTVALKAGLRLWVSGASGAGKTRLIGALMGLVEPADVPGLGAKSRFSRNLFSLCPQDATPLNGTIRENLLMAIGPEVIARPEHESRLLDALGDAGLGSRLKTLPKGLETWIGEGGVTLSGGERKRLALARAYLRDAPILILDEPTEGLDATTEAFVIERLEARLQRTGQGLIFTSHRPHPRRLGTSELRI